jgi:hypothetical protein
MSEITMLGITRERAHELIDVVEGITKEFPHLAPEMELGLEKISRHMGGENEKLFLAYIFGQICARLRS